jgi:hypothetical protein
MGLFTSWRGKRAAVEGRQGMTGDLTRAVGGCDTASEPDCDYPTLRSYFLGKSQRELETEFADLAERVTELLDFIREHERVDLHRDLEKTNQIRAGLRDRYTKVLQKAQALPVRIEGLRAMTYNLEMFLEGVELSKPDLWHSMLIGSYRPQGPQW